MTDRIPTTTRRAVLAGTAALPALHFPAIAATEPEDPAIGAVRRWFEADDRLRAYRSECFDHDFSRDPHGLPCTEDFRITGALSAESWDRFWEMVETAPTSHAGAALMLLAYAFQQGGSDVLRSRYNDPETWYTSADCSEELIGTIWQSPPVRELMAGATAAPVPSICRPAPRRTA